MAIKKIEQGFTYDCVVSGQVWSFTVVEVDADNESDIWITWMHDETAQEECHDIDSLLKKIEEHQNNCFAGIVYPHGDSEEAQAKALSELIEQPRYKFAGMEVPRAMVLTDHFSPEGYRPDREYMDFIFDQDKQILTMTSPDPEAAVPQWLLDRLPVVGVLKVDPSNADKKTTFFIQLNLDTMS